jgi:hypothetical protein
MKEFNSELEISNIGRQMNPPFRPTLGEVLDFKFELRLGFYHTNLTARTL